MDKHHSVNYEHLIENVRKHPCLWDSEAPEYKNSELKELAWCEVVKHCALFDVREARTFWKNLRDGHRQAIARKRNAGSVTKWRYEDQMKFLLPTMAIRSLKRPRKISPDTRRWAYMQEDTNTNSLQSEDSFSGEPQDEEYDNVHSYASDFVALEYEQAKKEIKTEIEDYLEKETVPNPILESTYRSNIESTYTLPTTKVAHQNKALEQFFMSMFETTNNLPEILQLQVQRQVFKIVMDAKEEHLTAK